jgi:hypothetical protein
MDEGTTNAEATRIDAAAGDEAASGTADAGPAAETTDGATPRGGLGCPAATDDR